MSLTINDNFALLVSYLQAQGDSACLHSETTDEYQRFIQAFPLTQLSQLSLDQYCIGKGDGASFCWWIERGLVPVLGRYMPGAAKGHILYFQNDGSLYKNRRLLELANEEALRYTLTIQSAIAATDPADMLWVDDDKEIYSRAGVEPRVTVAPGRKLRLLSCYHPADTLPISSSEHLAHYLLALGCPEQDIPRSKQPVARMLKLREYYQHACESVPGLSPYGFMRGLYSDELGMKPAKPESEQDALPGQPSYLLTWNPEHFKLGGDAGVALGDEVDWSCHSKQPQPGDAIYLVRLGQEPRGIVARGVVIEGAHDAPDWKDPSKTRNYIRFRIDEHRPNCASGLLPMLLLNKAMPKQRWNPQSSGVEISPAIAARLELLWQAGEGLHSLKQYTAWSSADRKESCPGWLKRYLEVTSLANALRTGQTPLDLPALVRLWLDRDNGVSSLKQGVLSRDELNTQQAALVEITQSILAAPTEQTHAQVMQRWRQGVEGGQFKMNRPAMINRVFAAIAPERFTSLLKAEDCQVLLAGLGGQFQLSGMESGGQDWCGLNQQIKACLAVAGVDEAAVLENNIAMWQLLEALQGREADEGGDDPQGVVDLIRSNISLNQILFGPPGTGKTHNTVNEALRILEPELVSKPGVQREELTVAFKRYVDNGQVVFCTFHQSFSYEDFVEGLRAHTVDGALQYRVEPGVFKRLCERARLGRPAVDDPFDQALKVLSEQLEASDGRLTLSTSKGKVFEVEYAGGVTFLVFPKSNEELKNGYTSNMEMVRKLYQTGSKDGIYNVSYVEGMLSFLRKNCGLPAYEKSVIPAAQRDKFVLIIDEINRGSVSRIFGELITLIEPSKRAGEPEALEVSLPYSKEPFSVPSNLYIVGTMNTADRSLAGLDIALRRRFTFKEMPPRAELLDGVVVANEIDIGELLREINQRIEVMLDRDHCLGHAYFIEMKDDLALRTLEHLADIFKQKILPLLQEYFFEDWERIGWVLNDQNAKANVSEPFVRPPANQKGLAALFGNEVANKLNDRRWELNEAAFNSIASYRNILGGAV